MPETLLVKKWINHYYLSLQQLEKIIGKENFNDVANGGKSYELNTKIQDALNALTHENNDFIATQKYPMSDWIMEEQMFLEVWAAFDNAETWGKIRQALMIPHDVGSEIELHMPGKDDDDG